MGRIWVSFKNQFYHPNNYYSNNNRSFGLPKRIKLVRQVAERHADDGDDDVRDGRPPLEDLDKELQAEVVDKDVDNGD